MSGNVGAGACVVHAVKADSTFDVLKTTFGGGRRDLVVDGRSDEIVGSSVENDVGRKCQVTDRVVLAVLSESTFVVF